MKQKTIEDFLAQMKKRADLLMNYFLAVFFVIGLLLSFYYDTWMIATGVGGLSLVAYFSSKAALPESDLYQYVLSVVLGIFIAQFIYQMHGMFEMHFFAFIASAILIIYRNWKLQIPLAVIVIIHHIVFGYLQFAGFGKIYFTQLEYMTLDTFAIHIILSIGIFFLCGLWAYKFNQSTNNYILQSFEVGKLQEAGQHKEIFIAMNKSLQASNEKLIKAHLELKTLFQNIEEVFFSVKIDFLEGHPCFTMLQMSPACLKVYGYEVEDFFRNQVLWRDVIVEEDKYIVDKNFPALLSGNSVVNENRIHHKDGSIRWLQARIKPTLNSDGLLIRLDGITTDITGKKLAQESLQRSEANLRTVFENTDTGYLLLNTDLRVISFNQQAEKFVALGLNSITLEGDHVIDYYPNERKLVMKKMMEDALKGKNDSYEMSYPQKDGSVIWYYIRLFGVMNQDKKIFALTLSISDITKWKQAEAELKMNFEKILVNEKLMKEAEKLAHFGSWQANFLNRTVEWSDETFRLYGYEQGEHAPSYKLFLQHVHPEDLQYVKTTLEKAVRLYDSQKLNFRIIDKNGEVKYIHAALMIERDKEGNVINVLGFKQDVTKKIMMEKRFKKEKRNKQQQITDAVITAQENERSFLGAELHDNINPILATVKLYLECVIGDDNKRTDLLKDSKGFINTAMDEIRTLSKTLLPPSLGEIGLVDAINDIIQNVRRVNDLKFITKWEGVQESLISKKMKLTIFRIVQEQLNNIFKHAAAKTVFIELKQQETMLELIIKDDGVGFDVFKKRSGVGLQNIISRTELFNGKVLINSAIGKGCELIVKFEIQQELATMGKILRA